jgi:hypothetical protein
MGNRQEFVGREVEDMINYRFGWDESTFVEIKR